MLRLTLKSSLFLLMILCTSLRAQDFTFDNTSLITVIEEIEKKTSYRFLYRESLIASVDVTLQSTTNHIIDDLGELLQPFNIAFKKNEERKQVLIYSASKNKTADKVFNRVISGFVVDAESGERLPYSTVSWLADGVLTGSSTNENGGFHINLVSKRDSLFLTFNYLGYYATKLGIDMNEQDDLQGLGIRLVPEPFSGKEILVQGFNFYTQTDSSTNDLIRVGMFSPLGESNALRSLQLLPSVSMAPALSNGINIRGSAADGFRVLLDGQTMYHQSHLFGLLDIMNPEALNTTGFFYGITPARYQAPLGGTLSLLTKPGSLTKTSASAGVSNTAASATLGGPLIKGRASWLLSGRTSLLNQLDWFGNSDLINFGLDVNRPGSVDISRFTGSNLVRDVSLLTSEVVSSEASFSDLHGKLYYEQEDGSRWALSGYLGNDDAQQLYRNLSVPELLGSGNTWATQMLTLSHQNQLSSQIISRTQIGFSDYSSRFNKDDFRYQLQSSAPSTVTTRIDSSVVAPLGIDNDLQEFSFSQSIIAELGGTIHEAGVSYKDLAVEYTENSLRQLSFRSTRTTQLLEFFYETDISLSSRTDIRVGSRVHYYSNGRYTRWSPRIKIMNRPADWLHAHAGLSRNHQFVHRLAFYNINSTDVWILSNEEQPPSSVWHLTTGVVIQPISFIRLNLDMYHKSYENLRLHELNTGSISSSFQSGSLPWFFSNEGRSTGLETLAIAEHALGQLSIGYTLSEVEIRNQNILDGSWFHPDWDRRHQLNIVSELKLTKAARFYTSWMLSSGVPERIDLQRITGNDRLGNYSRLDVALEIFKNVGNSEIKAAFNVFNLLDRNNPWYNEIVPVQVETRFNTFNRFALAQVYDLGIQPSFSVGIYF